jgi:hypothetical protein
MLCRVGIPWAGNAVLEGPSIFRSSAPLIEAALYPMVAIFGISSWAFVGR